MAKLAKKVGLLGAGKMGRDIALLLASSDIDVILRDVTARKLDKAQDHIEQSLEQQSKTIGIGQDRRREIQGHIRGSTKLSELSDCDFIIEAINEKEERKCDLLSELGRLSSAEALFASSTSSISIATLAKASLRPDKTLGMHFFHPVLETPVVELIRGIDTSKETEERAEALVEALGKTALWVEDSPGFVANRLLMSLINEAIFCLYEGISDRDSIDRLMQMSQGHQRGPLALADEMGLDQCLSILKVLHEDFGEDKYRPCPLLRKMVRSGRLGAKSGRGFYDYSQD